MKSPGVDIDLTDDDDTVSKIEITVPLLRNKRELVNSDALKVVNRITSNSVTCYHKIPLLTFCIHGTPLHTRNQYTKIRNKY